MSDLESATYYYFQIVQNAIVLAAPENLAVTVEGTAGTTLYGYKVTSLSSAGETLPCAGYYQ